MAGPAPGETLRLATFNPDLTRKGPGVLLRDVLKGKDPDIRTAINIIAHVHPDVLLLTGIDWDLRLQTLATFRDALAAEGADYPHMLAERPNTGMPTGRDLDRNGRMGEARDAQGWGKYTGAEGMAVLSKHPLALERDFSTMLWRDLPGNMLPTDWYDAATQDVLRLSSTAHWQVRVQVGPTALSLLAYDAGPPVFDGPEDRNGRRTHDETRFWTRFLDGQLSHPPPDGPLVVMGGANLDPADGDGRGEAIRALLQHPRLQDPRPTSAGAQEAANLQGQVNARHKGDAALDTVDWKDEDGGPGNLRVDYLLPSRDLNVKEAGVFWPASDQPLDDLLRAKGKPGSRHRLVWVDVILQGQ